MRTRWLDLGFVGLVVAGGAALRWIHLGTPSLWWDEVIDIAMARVGSVGDVLRVVREGVPAGSANAGAMPLDYVILHGWLAIAPAPRPESLEIFFRFPAFVWSVVALVAMAGFARCHLGREVGLVALLLLALSLPHVLYAAEVRWYSLLVLVTILHLWAFARLLDAPADARRWLLWVSCAAAAVLTAVLSIVPLAAELLVLAVVVERARGGRPRRRRRRARRPTSRAIDASAWRSPPPSPAAQLPSRGSAALRARRLSGAPAHVASGLANSAM